MQPNLIFEDSRVYRDSFYVDPVKGTYGKLSTGFCRGSFTVDPVKGTYGTLFPEGSALALLVALTLVEGEVLFFGQFLGLPFSVRNTVFEDCLDSTECN